MSSLFGIIRPVNAVNTEADANSLEAAKHKFPSAFNKSETAWLPGLGISGEYESSPLQDPHTQLFFQGIIFNRNEIMALADAPGNTESNAALVHALINAKGTDAVKKINGQFLIIYYDGRQNKISLINDHLGIQQVVYYNDKDILLFGTAVKFLLTHPACPKGIDWQTALRRPMPHIVLGSYKSYSTWFKGISLLPEASIMEVDMTTGNTEIKTYWKPQHTAPAKDDNRTATQVMEEYTALLEDAVKIRMATEGVTHSLLSGGLDSSAICGLAAKHGPIATYSIINQTTVLEDTTFFCRDMAEELQFKNDQFLIPYKELCFNTRLWQQRIWRAESPVNHTDSLTKTLVHYAIGTHHPEAVNILSGTGSDQMNGGLVGYVAPAADTPEESWANFHNGILDVENRRFVARHEESLWQVRRFIHRDFLASITGEQVAENPWMVYVDGAIHSQAYSLLWDEQRASASHGHTTLYPFLDFRMAEFIAAVPPRLHKDLFYDKQILREPSKKFLPEYIATKPKMPYNLPEYDFRAELYAFLTADGEDSLLLQAFGAIDTPHPVIDKKLLYSRIRAMRLKPEIIEWLDIMHIINLGLLERLAEKTEADMNYEAGMAVPERVSFEDVVKAKTYLEKRLSIMSTDELLDKPVRFGENCSLLLDIKSNKYYLSKRNNLTYEIDDEYAVWKSFLLKIDGKLTTRAILAALGVPFGTVEAFFRLSLKEQILVTSDKSPGY